MRTVRRCWDVAQQKQKPHNTIWENIPALVLHFPPGVAPLHLGCPALVHVFVNLFVCALAVKVMAVESLFTLLR